MATVTTRKRSTPDSNEYFATSSKKQARVTFGSIYNHKKLEVLGQGTYGAFSRHVTNARAILAAAVCLTSASSSTRLVASSHIAIT